ncbi:hypothetical protein Bca4012_058068 [Brassica carinata]|uniref:Uncharacterized protein n=1 Tax=Brassica carinata TaxID=52824 RepID=A0A8X7PNZ1_BRACI|nr:hypothetical protein Bca52824_084618 [Brassica carinata]
MIWMLSTVKKKKYREELIRSFCAPVYLDTLLETCQATTLSEFLYIGLSQTTAPASGFTWSGTKKRNDSDAASTLTYNQPGSVSMLFAKTIFGLTINENQSSFLKQQVSPDSSDMFLFPGATRNQKKIRVSSLSTFLGGNGAGGAVKRKRGRPRKYVTPEQALEAKKMASTMSSSSAKERREQAAAAGGGKTGQSFTPHIVNIAPDGDSETKKKSSGLSKIAVVAIVLCDVVGICLVGLLFTYCYSKFCACNNRDRHSKKRATECLCFRKDESETLSENMEHCDIVALDAQVAFNLEKLLKALQLDLALPAP